MVVLTTAFRLFSRTVSHAEKAHEEIQNSPLHKLPVPVLYLIALGCLVMAACFAGLTLGLMTLDTVGLEIMMQSGNPRDAEAAHKIMPVRKKAHLLLVTLLLGNTIATELLPLVLEVLFPGGVAALSISVVSIMLFGEIIPQAVCSRHALEIGSRMIGFVRVLRFLLYPVAAPIAWALDWMLGHELGQIYNREELKGLVSIHARSKYGALTQDESLIIQGTLNFSQRTVADVLTKAENVFSLNVDAILDESTLQLIVEKGHSRVPLYDGRRDNIVCLLLVKQLILVDKNQRLPIRALIASRSRRRVAPVLECSMGTPIADMLNKFQEGQSHLAIVYDDVSRVERKFHGILTLEDIIEEILQEEILDETDVFVDNTNTSLALPRREKHSASVVTQARVPGTKAILLREIPTQSVWKPRSEHDSARTPSGTSHPLVRVTSANRRARSDGFNLMRGTVNESLPLLPSLPPVDEELEPPSLLRLTPSAHTQASPSISMSGITGVIPVDLENPESPVGKRTTPGSVRSRPLPTYVPKDAQGRVPRWGSRTPKKNASEDPTKKSTSGA